MIVHAGPQDKLLAMIRSIASLIKPQSTDMQLVFPKTEVTERHRRGGTHRSGVKGAPVQ